MTTSNANGDEIKEYIAGIFDRAASSYDQVGARFFSHFGWRLLGVSKVFYQKGRQSNDR